MKYLKFAFGIVVIVLVCGLWLTFCAWAFLWVLAMHAV
jgi:hypothetical protein